MTRRKAIPQVTITDILYASARRCIYCFGLNQNLEVKDGQIAHLDRNPSNNKFQNLAWMCQPHHNDYDTKRRQTKDYNIDEALKYREELYALIERKRIEASKSLIVPLVPEPSPSKDEKLSEFSMNILQAINEPAVQLTGGMVYIMLLARFLDKTKLDLHLNKLIQDGYISNNSGVFNLLHKAKMKLYGNTL